MCTKKYEINLSGICYLKLCNINRLMLYADENDVALFHVLSLCCHLDQGVRSREVTVQV